MANASGLSPKRAREILRTVLAMDPPVRRFAIHRAGDRVAIAYVAGRLHQELYRLGHEKLEPARLIELVELEFEENGFG